MHLQVTSGAARGKPEISQTLASLSRAVGLASTPAGDRATLVGSVKNSFCIASFVHELRRRPRTAPRSRWPPDRSRPIPAGCLLHPAFQRSTVLTGPKALGDPDNHGPSHHTAQPQISGGPHIPPVWPQSHALQ